MLMIAKQGIHPSLYIDIYSDYGTSAGQPRQWILIWSTQLAHHNTKGAYAGTRPLKIETNAEAAIHGDELKQSYERSWFWCVPPSRKMDCSRNRSGCGSSEKPGAFQ
jgi:hypothetical protein